MAEKDASQPERIGGHEITGRFAEGPRGVVYLGRESEDAPQVVIKTLNADPAADPGFADRLRSLTRVSSPYAARTIEAGVEDGRPYVIREHVEGRSLAETVAQDGPLDVGAVERVAVGVLTALTAVHLAGFAHRSLTPSNVILTGEGPRVTDIELGDPAGEIGSRAPEQLAGLRYGPSADVFSWAAVVVFAATGSAPFGHDEENVLNGEPEIGELPEPLRQVVLDALAKQADGRPTAYAALLRLLGDVPVPAPPAVAGNGIAGGAEHGSVPRPTIQPIHLNLDGVQQPTPMDPPPASRQQPAPVPHPDPVNQGAVNQDPAAQGPVNQEPENQGHREPAGPVEPVGPPMGPMGAVGPMGPPIGHVGPPAGAAGPMGPVPVEMAHGPSMWGPPPGPGGQVPPPPRPPAPPVVPEQRSDGRERKPFPVGLVAGLTAVVLLSGLGIWGASQYTGKVTYSPIAAATTGTSGTGGGDAGSAPAQGTETGPPPQPQSEVTAPWATASDPGDGGIGPMQLPTEDSSPSVPELSTPPTPGPVVTQPVPIPTAQPTVTRTQRPTAEPTKPTKTAKPKATVTKTVQPSKKATPRPTKTTREPEPTPDRTTAEPTPTRTTQAPAPTPAKTTKKPTPTPAKTTAEPVKKNPYTATQVCGGGFVVQRSSSFSGGTTYQLWNNGTGQNCVVTLKSGADVGKATSTSATLEVQGGSSKTDSGNFEYYAGPVILTAKGKCVRYSGSAGSGSTSAAWANCG